MDAKTRRAVLDASKNLGGLGLGAVLRELLERRRDQGRPRPAENRPESPFSGPGVGA